MKYVKPLLCWILDNALAWVTPAWRRNGREAMAALQRYANYNRHTLNDETLTRLSTHRADIYAALLNWNKEECTRLTSLVELQCGELPGFKRNAVVEIVESFFVIMVIFLGLRTYYVQPFRIPTGSMQPSLNGIIVHPVDEVPGAIRQAWDMITLGSSYVEATAENSKSIVDIDQHSKWLLFTETTLVFNDGSKVNIPSPKEP